jgi:SNF2 family DNA or RNA helicase
MGLGKTLATLALICWYLDILDSTKHEEKSSKRLKTTLIVVPKTSMDPLETSELSV